jgi:hypothetical protein
MTFEEIARSLIQAVGGIESEKNIQGVMEVFNGIKRGVHNQWEEHLCAEATDFLMYNEILCSCGKLIEVTSSVNGVATKEA